MYDASAVPDLINKLKHVERWSYSLLKKLWEKDDIQFADDFLFVKIQYRLLKPGTTSKAKDQVEYYQ
jgi:hypothetical protein